MPAFLIKLLIFLMVCSGITVSGLIAEDFAVRRGGKPVYLQSEEIKEGRNPSNWWGRIGMGGQISPDFLGADHHSYDVALDIKASYKDTLFIENNKLGAVLHKGHMLRAGLLTRAEFGRRNHRFSKAFTDMPKVGNAVELGMFASTSFYKLFLSAEAYADISGVHHGFVAEVELGYTFEFNSRLKVTPIIGTGWGSSRYMQTYFGVIRGLETEYPAFRPSAGIYEWYGEIAGEHPIGASNWLVKADVRYARLAGEAAKSPIVLSEKGSKNQLSAILAIIYLF